MEGLSERGEDVYGQALGGTRWDPSEQPEQQHKPFSTRHHGP